MEEVEVTVQSILDDALKYSDNPTNFEQAKQELAFLEKVSEWISKNQGDEVDVTSIVDALNSTLPEGSEAFEDDDFSDEDITYYRDNITDVNEATNKLNRYIKTEAKPAVKVRSRVGSSTKPSSVKVPEKSLVGAKTVVESPKKSLTKDEAPEKYVIPMDAFWRFIHPGANFVPSEGDSKAVVTEKRRKAKIRDMDVYFKQPYIKNNKSKYMAVIKYNNTVILNIHKALIAYSKLSDKYKGASFRGQIENTSYTATLENIEKLKLSFEERVHFNLYVIQAAKMRIPTVYTDEQLNKMKKENPTAVTKALFSGQNARVVLTSEGIKWVGNEKFILPASLTIEGYNDFKEYIEFKTKKSFAETFVGKGLIKSKNLNALFTIALSEKKAGIGRNVMYSYTEAMNEAFKEGKATYDIEKTDKGWIKKDNYSDNSVLDILEKKYKDSDKKFSKNKLYLRYIIALQSQLTKLTKDIDAETKNTFLSKTMNTTLESFATESKHIEKFVTDFSNQRKNIAAESAKRKRKEESAAKKAAKK
jgi:hypothetical protein